MVCFSYFWFPSKGNNFQCQAEILWVCCLSVLMCVKMCWMAKHKKRKYNRLQKHQKQISEKQGRFVFVWFFVLAEWKLIDFCDRLLGVSVKNTTRGLNVAEHLHGCYLINTVIVQLGSVFVISVLSCSCHLVKFHLMKLKASVVVFHLGGRLWNLGNWGNEERNLLKLEEVKE